MTEADTELSENLMEEDELSGFDDHNEDLDDYWNER
jgi:hypothetical protein